MPKRKSAFNNKKITALCKEYSANPSEHTRNRILKYTLPLIRAAMVKKHIPEELKDDIYQECVVKLLKAIPKFNVERGNSFAFFWTVICNTIITQQTNMTSLVNSNVSLTPSASDDSEMDSIGANLFTTPENQHILSRASKALDAAFKQAGFHTPKGRKHRLVLEKIKQAIWSGDLFFNRHEVMRTLRKVGIDKEEVKGYIEYTLVKVRQFLLDTRRDIDALSTKAEGVVPAQPASRIPASVRGRTNEKTYRHFLRDGHRDPEQEDS